MDIKKISKDFVNTSNAVIDFIKKNGIDDQFVVKNHAACKNDFIKEFDNFKKLVRSDDDSTKKSVNSKLLDHQNQMIYDLEYMKKLLRDTKKMYNDKKSREGDTIMENIFNISIDESSTNYVESQSESPEGCKHSWTYGGGQAKCVNCGWYLQPGGEVTRTPTGRERKPKNDTGVVVNEAVDNSSESNVKLAVTNAEQTLSTLAKSIMNNNGKITDYTLNTIANIISNNLLREWANGFTKLTIRLLPKDSKLDFEFVPPGLSAGKAITNEFVKRFIYGNESLVGYLHRVPEITIKVSDRIFKTLKSEKDLCTCFKNAIRYYDFKIDQGANDIARQLFQLDSVTKGLLKGPLNGVVVYALSLLFIFQDIDIGNSNNPFKVSKDMIETVNKFISDITTTYSKPEKEKSKIIDDLKKLVDMMIKNTTYTETMRSLQKLPDTIQFFYNSGFDDEIKKIADRFEFEQCESMITPVIFNEKTTVKRLKKIPADLIAYITIEGENIRTANDKMMIVSYAYGKLEIIEWYIELLEVGTKNYIVPHSREYLENMRTQLLAAIKTIMNVKIKSPDDPIISVKYPRGYEG